MRGIKLLIDAQTALSAMVACDGFALAPIDSAEPIPLVPRIGDARGGLHEARKSALELGLLHG